MTRDLRFTDYFLFTQHSLATFDNCPLKFRKRYLESLKWDSYPDENIKRRLEMGNSFHLLAHRYFLGIDTGLEGLEDEGAELSKWMESLKKNFPLTSNTVYLPEYKLRMVSSSLKLEANFDLLLVRDGNIEIWDWKTHSEENSGKSKSNSQRLLEGLQTVVYMFVLKEQSGLVAGEELGCDRISMHYWQPDPAKVVAEVQYSDELHAGYQEMLENRIRNILSFDYSGFDKALYSRHCRFCEFNWFCNNERIDYRAIEEEEDEFLEELSWDDIEEKY